MSKHQISRALGLAGLALCAILFMKTGEPQGQLMGIDVSTWRDAVLQVAPVRVDIFIISCVFLLIVTSSYKLLFSPLELLKSSEDVGYIADDGRSKARAANEVRRRKKTGDLPPIYPNGWFRVLDSHMLKIGEVRDVTVVGVNLAVFRGEDGKAHVLDAYCPHLGANLAVGGRVVGSCIECPFHGWQFQGDSGKCENIPYAEKVPDFAKVDVWHSCEVNGQILVWFHCDGEEPQWTVPEQEEITKGEWVYRGRTEHYVNAHIEEIPENAADLSHLTYLHTPGIVSGVDLRYTKNKTWQFVQHHWKAQWASESSPFNHCSQMLLKHSLHVFGIHWPLLDLHVVARQVGPGLVFLRFDHSFLGSGMIMQSVTPVEPLLQCVSHTIFYQSNIPAFVPKFILKGESIQFERDVMIWNNKTYISKPLLVKEDSTIRKHRRWYSQFYSENSPRFQYQRDTLEF
ncbi:cholesterol 7-desaturase nvd isoform X3 [Corythoichthys intestinalis]|uniref:cholesterol 7-desaturase nvd isoform X3 n=1 Tax=Corythoichthys intestinalis TaxID=161448 RepID=UPI0025A65B6B|nr:cholesterol 7-desaturase nvd isoform X3 [Corythoichthys intestinalis]XP_061800175.1 cholesterol 7-desaturase nvd-like [Nerophis lumbriciformis]